MKVAYIAGPYSAESHNELYENMQVARRYAVKYWKLGYAVICPHLNTAFMDGIVNGGNKFEDWPVFLIGDFELLKRSDIVVMIPGWRDSKGAVEEHTKAVEWGKEIIDEEFHRRNEEENKWPSHSHGYHNGVFGTWHSGPNGEVLDFQPIHQTTTPPPEEDSIGKKEMGQWDNAHLAYFHNQTQAERKNIE